MRNLKLGRFFVRSGILIFLNFGVEQGELVGTGGWVVDFVASLGVGERDSLQIWLGVFLMSLFDSLFFISFLFYFNFVVV